MRIRLVRKSVKSGSPKEAATNVTAVQIPVKEWKELEKRHSGQKWLVKPL